MPTRPKAHRRYFIEVTINGEGEVRHGEKYLCDVDDLYGWKRVEEGCLHRLLRLVRSWANPTCASTSREPRCLPSVRTIRMTNKRTATKGPIMFEDNFSSKQSIEESRGGGDHHRHIRRRHQVRQKLHHGHRKEDL